MSEFTSDPAVDLHGEGVRVGEMVHYAALDRSKPKCYAALVVDGGDGSARSLKVFHFGLARTDVTKFVVRHDPEREPGTYHSIDWCDR